MSTANGTSNNLDKMSFHELRQECKKSKISASGTAEALRKRLRSSKQTQGNANAKRQKTSIADEFICAISLELPWDPVTAEDGRVYERECIEEHIKKNDGDLKSPITNEKMGNKLLPAIQVWNAIEKLVESGVIDGDLAAKWIEKVKQKKSMEELLKEAEGGDDNAMVSVGGKFYNGCDGFKQDKETAFRWYKRAHEAGNVPGTALMGLCYLGGWGVTKCSTKGVGYTAIAAGRGSNLAAFELGFAFAESKYGFSVDNTEAIHWLEKAVGQCPFMHLNQEYKKRAQQQLNELRAQQQP